MCVIRGLIIISYLLIGVSLIRAGGAKSIDLNDTLTRYLVYYLLFLSQMRRNHGLR